MRRQCLYKLALINMCRTFSAQIVFICLSPAGVRTVDVQAVEGMVAQFPCDLGTAANDKVYMVFWFRDDAGIPLYRYVESTYLRVLCVTTILPKHFRLVLILSCVNYYMMIINLIIYLFRRFSKRFRYNIINSSACYDIFCYKRGENLS